MRVHLVDGTYELFRCFHGAPRATGPGGDEVGAGRALLATMAALLREPGVTHVAVAFDSVVAPAGLTKAGAIAEPLGAQVPLAAAVVRALGITVWPSGRFKADELLASGARRYRDDPRVERVVLCTTDLDLAQCVVQDRVDLLDRSRRVVTDEVALRARFGVAPSQLADLFALVGDRSDGIAGVPGFGLRTAAALVGSFGSLEAIPGDPAGWPATVRGRDRLAAALARNRREALHARDLLRLRDDAPIRDTVDDLEWRGPHPEEIAALVERLGAPDLAAGIPDQRRSSVARRGWRREQTMARVEEGAIDSLRHALAGEVCVPGDAGFDEACSIWNGAITKRPAVVARCGSNADVAAALAFGQREGLEVSVRGGGHNYAGFALSDGGLTIDLTPMKDVTVDAAARRAVCGGGTTWGELDAATQEHGLAVPGGFISHTGIAGLTLGGGFGWLSRYAGLSSDNLAGAEVVTADGSVLHVSAGEHDDLYWALRGGGGNFGVVTSFEFALREVGPLVQLGMFFYAPEQGGDALRFGREYVRDLPDECGVFMAGLNAPPEPFVPEQHQLAPVYAIAVVGLRDEEAHARLLAPLREGPAPLFELVTPIPYVALQQMFNASAPWGILGYEKAVYLDELSDGAVDVIVEHQARKASPLSFLPIFVLGGAFSRVADDATAFGGRRATRYVVNISAACPTPELYEADRNWVREFWAALVPHAEGVGSYVNFMTEYEEDRVRAAYGAEKYERLARIKATYDPGNVLHLNANIQPAT